MEKTEGPEDQILGCLPVVGFFVVMSISLTLIGISIFA